ncbi:MAG: alpha/beta fold hydrolase [Chloroflexi bacterium]|nr:alpha/beta fold hydrolase [Chloroflexota bacterium]
MKVFIHGLISSGQGFKGRFLRQRFPDMLTPDFPGDLDERMARLEQILAGSEERHILIGSSFGGLMAALYACARAEKVAKLILLAPALIYPAFADNPPGPCPVPTVIFHGRRDDIVPLEPTRSLARQVFSHLRFHVVDDDHMLHQTVKRLDWEALLEETMV